MSQEVSEVIYFFKNLYVRQPVVMKVYKVKDEVRQLRLKYMLLYNFNATCFGLSRKGRYQSNRRYQVKAIM